MREGEGEEKGDLFAVTLGAETCGLWRKERHEIDVKEMKCLQCLC